MSNKALFLIFVAVIGLSASAMAEYYSGGTGEPNDPFIIATPEDLNDIGNHTEHWDKHFVLINDVNLAGYIGTQFNIIGEDWENPFTGVFDGQGHKISKFTWHGTGRLYVGLFGYINNGQVKNLALEDVDVNTPSTYVGGIAGLIRGSWIFNCHANGNVKGNQFIGGLVGEIGQSAAIFQCYSTCDVKGHQQVGGLVGFLGWGEIVNCYAVGSVKGDWCIGGLVGENFGPISRCYATGSVLGDGSVGGLVGGGLGGVFISFWDVETSGQTTSDGGTGKTTAEMKTKSTFTDAGWDFIAETENGTDEIWTINEQIDYPRFVWQLVDCAGSFGVDFADYAVLANFWLDQNCADSNNCAGTDFDFSGSIDFVDLGALAQHWLRSN